MKIDKLLAVSFAFVMVTSLIFPAYAQVRNEVDQALSPAEIGELLTPSSNDNIIYQNGNNPVPGLDTFIDNSLVADDFVLGASTDVTDAHFTFSCFTPTNCPNIEPLAYFIFADNGGQPGAVIDSGIAQNVQVMNLGGLRNEVWFDFEVPVPLDGGVTHWFGLTYMPAIFTFEPPEPEWEFSDVVTGNTAWIDDSLPPNIWFPLTVDMWFQLTGDKVVGGEFIPIDSTALMLAGLQSSAIWMLPVLTGLAGAGFYLIKFRTNKE